MDRLDREEDQQDRADAAKPAQHATPAQTDRPAQSTTATARANVHPVQQLGSVQGARPVQETKAKERVMLRDTETFRKGVSPAEEGNLEKEVGKIKQFMKRLESFRNADPSNRLSILLEQDLNGAEEALAHVETYVTWCLQQRSEGRGQGGVVQPNMESPRPTQAGGQRVRPGELFEATADRGRPVRPGELDRGSSRDRPAGGSLRRETPPREASLRKQSPGTTTPRRRSPK